MSSSTKWPLNDNWAVGRDPYNWILYRRSGNRWRADSFHQTPSFLLISFHMKLNRIEPPQPTLVEHIEHCFDVAQAAADLFNEHVEGFACSECRNRLGAASTSLEEVDHAS